MKLQISVKYWGSIPSGAASHDHGYVANDIYLVLNDFSGILITSLFGHQIYL